MTGVASSSFQRKLESRGWARVEHFVSEQERQRRSNLPGNSEIASLLTVARNDTRVYLNAIGARRDEGAPIAYSLKPIACLCPLTFALPLVFYRRAWPYRHEKEGPI
jgi:hypothetical protein